MKKILFSFALILCLGLIGVAKASPIAFYNGDKPLFFNASASVQTLYPYGKEQVDMFSMFFKSCTLEGFESKNFSAYTFDFGKENVFFHAQFNDNEEHFAINSLFNGAILKTKTPNILSRILPLPKLPWQLKFDEDKALKAWGEFKALTYDEVFQKSHKKVKNIGKAKYEMELPISEEDFHAFLPILFLGQEIRKANLNGENAFGQLYFDASKTLLGLEFHAPIEIDGTTQQVNLSFFEKNNGESFELNIKYAEKSDIFKQVIAEKNEKVHYFKVIEKNAKDVLTQSVEHNIVHKKSKKKEQLKGDILFDEVKKGTENFSNSLKLDVDVELKYIENYIVPVGKVKVLMEENNIAKFNGTLTLNKATPSTDYGKMSHAFDVAKSHGGIENNTDYLKSIFKNELTAENLHFVDLDDKNSYYVKGLQMNVVDNFTLSLLHTMLKQMDISKAILSFGMEDEFAEFLKNMKKELMQ